MNTGRRQSSEPSRRRLSWLAPLGFFLAAALVVGLGSVAQAAPVATLTAPVTGMVHVPVPYSVTVKPVPSHAVARLQTASSSGWVKIDQVAIDANGQAKGTVVSTVTGTRSYRAAIVDRTTGRVLAYSATITISYSPLLHTAGLSCAKSTAPVGVDVACSIVVTPKVRVSGLNARLEVRGRSSWVPIDSWGVPSSGTITTDVEGFEPGVGRYRVRLFRSGTEVSVSNTVTIAWT